MAIRDDLLDPLHWIDNPAKAREAIERWGDQPAHGPQKGRLWGGWSPASITDDDHSVEGDSSDGP